MNDTRTTSILQRVPAILAVTASSYGLNFQPGEARKPRAAGQRRNERSNASDKPAAQR